MKTTTELTTSELKMKIIAKESFWVGSDNERKKVLSLASAIGIPYHTSSAGRGGFNAHFLPKLNAKGSK